MIGGRCMKKDLIIIIIFLFFWSLPLIFSTFFLEGLLWTLYAFFWTIIGISCFLIDYYRKRYYERPILKGCKTFAILEGCLGLILTPIIYQHPMALNIIMLTYMILSMVIAITTRLFYLKRLNYSQ